MRFPICPAILTLIMWAVHETFSCGPGPNGQSRKRYQKMKLTFRQMIPNVEETSLAASGKYTGKVIRGSDAYKALVSNFNTDIVFRDDEKTGDDRRMTPRCSKVLDKLAKLVKAEWPDEDVRLRVIDAYDTDNSVKKHHAEKSLHHEGRAVDIATSDHKADRYPILGRLAYNAGFDWVFYASRGYIHASVKTDEDAENLKKGNYCFPETATVLREDGRRVQMNELRTGDKVETTDIQSGQIIFSKVLAFLDYKVDSMVDFIVIETESPPARLVITESHLLYKQNKQTQLGAAVHARDINVGDYVYVRSNLSTTIGLTPGRVTSLRKIRARGAYAPLTESGNVLVDNVLSSCYALVHNHALAHWSFAPLRLLESLKPDHSPAQQEGMHWYAKFLYEGYIRWRYVEDLVMNKYVQYVV